MRAKAASRIGLARPPTQRLEDACATSEIATKHAAAFQKNCSPEFEGH